MPGKQEHEPPAETTSRRKPERRPGRTPAGRPPVDTGPAQVIFGCLAAVRQRQDQITQALTEQARELQKLRGERDQLRRVVDDLQGKAAAERERQEQEAQAKQNRRRERTKARVQRWRELHPEQVAQQRREDRARRRKTQT